MTPNAIAEHFDTTRQAVSKHLHILKECEVVKTEQQGREIFYSLEVDKMKVIDKWMEQFRSLWEDRFDNLDKLLAKIKRTMKNKSYCAFLRGVNVKGNNMKMADVCAVFEKAGMENVSSVLASGNIIFSSDKEKEELKVLLEKAMSTHFAYEAFLFVKDKAEVESVCNKILLKLSILAKTN